MYTIETIEVFKRHPEFQSLQAVLTVGDSDSSSGPGRIVKNLSLARIFLINKGNVDIERFDFGATLKGSNEAIEVRAETPDRHHALDILKPVDLLHPTNELDFTLRPFNRGDKYKISVFLLIEILFNQSRLGLHTRRDL